MSCAEHDERRNLRTVPRSHRAGRRNPDAYTRRGDRRTGIRGAAWSESSDDSAGRGASDSRARARASRCIPQCGVFRLLRAGQFLRLRSGVAQICRVENRGHFARWRLPALPAARTALADQLHVQPHRRARVSAGRAMPLARDGRCRDAVSAVGVRISRMRCGMGLRPAPFARRALGKAQRCRPGELRSVATRSPAIASTAR